MDIVGDRKFVEVPGGKTHELPPLLIRSVPQRKSLDRVVNMANDIVDSEDMLADWTSIEFVYKVCSFLPAIGLIPYFLPTMRRTATA